MMKIQKTIINGFFNILIILALMGCVGSGGEPTGDSGGGPVGGAPAPISGISTGLNGPGPVGGVTVSAASPEMPDLPVAPNVDVEDDNRKKVEIKIEGKLVSVCQDPDESKIRKNIEAQLLCRWKDTSDEFIVCGRGRYLRIVDKVTHQYIDTQSNTEEGRFEFEFIFNIAQKSLKEKFGGEKALLLASMNMDKDYLSDAVPKNRDLRAIGKSAIVDKPYGDKKDLPFDPGDKFDAEDINKFSDSNNLLIYAWGYELQPNEMGVQKFCTFEYSCGTGFNNPYITLGPINFLENEEVSAGNISLCEN